MNLTLLAASLAPYRALAGMRVARFLPSARHKNRLFFVRLELKAFTLFMFNRFVILSLVFLLAFSACKKASLVSSAQAANSPSPAAKAAKANVAASPSAAPANTASPAAKGGKTVVDQTAQVIIFCYHRLVDKIRYPGTEITPAAFEEQMKQLKDRGITVIGMQDLLAWRRGEKSIPPRCAVISFDDGWKSQYEVAWPILKKYGYPVTMFIYTEGVRGGLLAGGEAITWEQLADMRDNGVDIEAHSATHQDLREGHMITITAPGAKKTRKKLTGPEYEQWLQNEVVGCKQLLEQRLAIRVNCFAVPFGTYNEHVKEIARNTGYEAMFTVYGQPLTFTSPLDSLGRYAIEANKPKVFEDAIKTIATSSGGAAAVAEVGAANLSTQPADGETIRTALPLIKANISGMGQIDPGSVQMRVSGLGMVPATYDAKTGTVAYQVTQKLHEKSCTVILSAKSEGKRIETHWTFGIDEGGAPAAAPAASPAPKKK
jgi:peptidoglycan/xylan/chitin deacetylase (PgdA/CDA1 family)